MTFTITRQEIADKALSMRGVRFLHQGRSRETGVDCVGFLAVILTEFCYPIVDVVGYRSNPPAKVIYDTLCKNFDEIPVNEVSLGDIFLMRIGGGRKPKHASILVNDKTDLANGVEFEIVHAYALGGRGKVVKEPLAMWRTQCVRGFRFRGLID